MIETPSHFLSCDWGTTSFRLRLVGVNDRQVVAQVSNAGGAKVISLQLAPGTGRAERAEAFASHLRSSVGELLAKSAVENRRLPIIVSGMATSSVGWKELPYAAVPFRLDGADARIEWLQLERPDDSPLPVLLVSGVASAWEMMRGEETQVMGLLALPQFAMCREESLVILPGTHSKHIRVRDRKVTDLQTYMTGELFQVLTEHSILKFTTADADPLSLDQSAFRAGVDAARSPGLASSLFQVRARGILGGQPSDANRSFLSGLLVGAELVDLERAEFAGSILLAAPDSIASQYQLAADALGIGRRLAIADGETLDRAVVEGQYQLWRQFAERLKP